MKNRKHQFEKALQLFIEQIRDDPDIVGIIASGSFIHGHIDKHSDLDVFVILAPDRTYRERGNTWIQGVEIEYFKNPPSQVRAYFRSEGDKPHTADIFANGKVQLDRHPVVGELLQEAQEIMRRKAKPLTPQQRELAKYGLDDHRKDYWDCLDNGDELSARIIGAEIIRLCIQFHFQLRQQFPVKKKRLLKYLKSDDPEFERILRKAIDGNCRELDEKSLLALISHIETRLGGSRGKEWVLKTDLALG